jgi:ferric-dicitrate binding protein FerR (iron transport regulator)
MPIDEREYRRLMERMREIPDAQAAQERVERELLARTVARPPRRWRVAAVAATALLIVGGMLGALVWLRQTANRDPTWGPVILQDAAAPASQREIGADQEIQAPGGTRIDAGNLATIALSRTSDLAVRQAGERFWVELRRGSAEFRVRPLRPLDQGLEFSVKTPELEVLVKGTVFTVDADETGTRIAVQEGSVLVLRAGLEIPVAAPQNFEAPRSATLEPVAAPPAPQPQPVPAAPSNDRKKDLALAVPGSKPAPGPPAPPPASPPARASEVGPGDSEDALFRQGQIELLELKHHAQAIATFQRYTERYPQGTYREEAIFHIAEAYGQQDDLANATIWFERFIQISQNAGRRAAANLDLGALVMRLEKDCKVASRYFTQALAGAPRDIEIQALRGLIPCRLQLGETETLAPLVDRLEAIAPADPMARQARERLRGE